jgi:hypothetical protein
LLSAGAVCAALLGCATPKFLTSVNCTGGSCEVDVHVDIQGSTSTVSAPNINNTGANNIFWRIDDASQALGYKFPDPAVHAGVWIKDPPPSGCLAPGNVFDSPQRLTDVKFKLHNKGTPGTYCYGVQVVRSSAPTPCTLDPQIVNN